VSPPTTPSAPVESIPTPREVTYTTNSVALSLTAKDVLRALAKKLTAGGSITVVGYAHDNALLARRRAAAVANFLVHLVSVHVSIKVVTTSIVDKVMVITTKA
jgi:outer membrane protein OmpA-like peptidoglycan-associated protein